jgi:hypothetical protein
VHHDRFAGNIERFAFDQRHSAGEVRRQQQPAEKRACQPRSAARSADTAVEVGNAGHLDRHLEVHTHRSARGVLHSSRKAKVIGVSMGEQKRRDVRWPLPRERRADSSCHQ